MVLAYQCPEHGLHDECDVDKSGERICPEGASTAVTGIVGSTRKGHVDDEGTEHISGDTEWDISLGYGSKGTTVTAFDVEGAFEATMEKFDDPHITEIKPKYITERRTP